MSWIFGKKKHKESPSSSPEAEPSQLPEDEFIFVEKKTQSEPYPIGQIPQLYPRINTMLPYPPLSFPTPNVTLQKQSSQEGQTNDLNRIPFKLCKELERSMNEDLVIDKLRVNEISSFIKRVNMEDYDYKFSLERSIVAEMSSQNEE